MCSILRVTLLFLWSVVYHLGLDLSLLFCFSLRTRSLLRPRINLLIVFSLLLPNPQNDRWENALRIFKTGEASVGDLYSITSNRPDYIEPPSVSVVCAHL